MDPRHERVTRIGLDALGDRGFALAGGYAVAAHGIGSRQSEDVDLFTDQLDVSFENAVNHLGEAYRAEGYQVDVARQAAQYARLVVADQDGAASEIDLGVDYRTHPVAQLEIGPVLHIDDAVGSKVSAMYGRGEARDYLDVHAALATGRFTRDRLVELGDQREATPMDRDVLAQQLAAGSRIKDRQFKRYGASDAEIASVRTTMAGWAAELRARQADPNAADSIRRAQAGLSGPAAGSTGSSAARLSGAAYGRGRGVEGPER
jgi:predicted nucleotidyltransferase component of viral defense system